MNLKAEKAYRNFDLETTGQTLPLKRIVLGNSNRAKPFGSGKAMGVGGRLRRCYLVGKLLSWSCFLGTSALLPQNPHSASTSSVHLLFSLPKQRCINKNIKQRLYIATHLPQHKSHHIRGFHKPFAEPITSQKHSLGKLFQGWLMPLICQPMYHLIPKQRVNHFDMAA